jgi:antitoxin component YwqK of YwqJK toxin-antitoxin module
MCLVLSAHAQEVSPTPAYELDTTATANAPWKVGEIIPNTRQTMYDGNTHYVYRKFLGMTTRGYYLVQDFYEKQGQKLSDPYVLIDREDVDREENQRNRVPPKIDGPYIRWYLNGQKRWEGYYVDGKKEGPGVGWSKLGNKWSEGYFKNDLHEGLWTRWYSNGSKKTEEHYINGALNGPYIEWDPQGNKTIEGHYVNGKKEDLWAEWNSAGELIYQGNYRNGEKEGEWYESNHEYGFVSEGRYIHGVKEGLWREWWYARDGRPRSEGYYRNGLRQGNWKLWSDCNDECRENRMDQGHYENDEQVGEWTQTTFEGTDLHRIVSIERYVIGKN